MPHTLFSVLVHTAATNGVKAKLGLKGDGATA